MKQTSADEAVDPIGPGVLISHLCWMDQSVILRDSVRRALDLLMPVHKSLGRSLTLSPEHAAQVAEAVAICSARFVAVVPVPRVVRAREFAPTYRESVAEEDVAEEDVDAKWLDKLAEILPKKPHLRHDVDRLLDDVGLDLQDDEGEDDIDETIFEVCQTIKSRTDADAFEHQVERAMRRTWESLRDGLRKAEARRTQRAKGKAVVE